MSNEIDTAERLGNHGGDSGMLENIFVRFVNLSLTAGWLVLAVIVLRLILKKAPKWIFCILWGLVALRLILPVSIESRLSLIPSTEVLPSDITYTAHPQIHSGIAVIDDLIRDDKIVENVSENVSENNNPDSAYGMLEGKPEDSANPTQILSFILSRLWLAGLAGMLLYALVSYRLLRRKVMTAVRHVDNIFFCEYVTSPFLLGIIKPRIYLPYEIDENEREFVIAHEKAHIARRDHWWKPLGFILLAVYWFNPLIWVAYILLCRDIESACDEKVISDMGTEERRSYSSALLNASLGIKRRRIAACPLAFGETGVKNRIKNVMNYKKPVFWVIVAAVIGCVALAVCFLTDPAQKGSSASDGQERADINGSGAELDLINGNSSRETGDGTAEALAANTATNESDGIARSESIFSDNIYNAIQEDWDRWDEKDEFSKMISSSLPGAGSRYFETWEEAVEFLGVEPWNPLEDADWLQIMNYTGADIKDMFDPDMLPHCSLTWYGTKDNKLSYAEITTGYAVDDVRVTLKIDLHTASQNTNEQSGNPQSGNILNNNDGPSGIRLSETFHERATAKQAEFRHVNKDGYYFDYNLRCVILETGEKALAKPAEVMNRVLEYMGMGGIPTTTVDMMGPDRIPGTDVNTDMDYFIDFGDEAETDELQIEYKNEEQ
ncbi:MAG: M56 family metallopeptidase [Lachnospiraceae bacterium]|nr:M56 family metallopeptidase [Lachnospiraceae bacterium]